MFDTYITVIGTVLNNPEKKVTKNNNLLANFRVASHARRFDKQAGEWVDGESLRIRVTCWRRLAEHVCSSIYSGDAVVVHGRIATRDWKNEEGEARIAYTLEAVAVGHDLSRGTATFTRSRPEPSGLVVEEPDDASEEFSALEGRTDDEALAILAEAGLHVPEPGEEEDGVEEEASANPDRRRRSRQPVAA
jgi:single-strand DNA-binding protein